MREYKYIDMLIHEQNERKERTTTDQILINKTFEFTWMFTICL